MAFRIRCVCLGLGLFAVGSASAGALAVHGRARASVVLCARPTPAETTAARELAAYLSKATGGRFTVTGEAESPKDKPCLYVGPTAFAKRHGLDASKMGPEQWAVRSVGDDLALVGGRPRGTLYAVYRFLEDVVGVHWWNPFEESVPRKPNLSVGTLDLTGQPTFRYRDIYMLYGNDRGRFAARNRLNRDGDAGIAAAYGGEMDYGPPYHVHTFHMYVPPKAHFAEHPEWFSLIKGKRTAHRAQLCLTNAQVRALVIQKLRAYIEAERARAKKAGGPAPVVFDISQNDWGGMCQCPACQAIATREGSEAGPLLDFLNHVADAIRGDYPGVLIDTLAYQMTQKAPASLRPRDNLIIRLCDTTSNFTRPVVHPENQAFRDHLLSWARIAKNLRVWDYAVTYAPYYGLPLPTVHTYPVDYRFYAEHHVTGVFTEHEYPILADLRDLKIWMMIKLLEDPYRDYAALLKTFTDGFYGPAGPQVRRYLAALEAAAAAKPSYLSMGASPRKYRYLDLAFIRAAQAIFDQAEKAVEAAPTLLRRVRFARLALDRASVVLFPQLVKEWLREGNELKSVPLDREAIAQRYRRTWHTEADLRLPKARRAAHKARADAEVQYLLARRAHVPVPKRFRHLPADRVFHYTADETRNWKDLVKRVPEPDSESGITNRLELDAALKRDPTEDRSYKLPMPWGLYEVARKRSGGSATLKPRDVPGPGYHWYRLGTFPVVASDYLWFFWSWIIQLDVDDVVDPRRPDQTFEVWARIKFEGPGFPHGKAGDRNAICIERVVLVKAVAD